MAISVLNQNLQSLLNVATGVIASPANLTSGSTLIMGISIELDTATGITVSDTHNGSWGTADGIYQGAGNGGTNGAGTIAFFHVANTRTGTSGNITVSWTGTSYAMLSFYEVTGLGLPFDITGTGKTGTTRFTALGYSITPTYSPELVIAVGLSYTNTNVSVDTNYAFPTNNNSITLPDGLNNCYHSHEFYTGASGTQSLNFNGAGGTQGTGGATMFAAAYGTVTAPSIIMGQACL